jgi:transposase
LRNCSPIGTGAQYGGVFDEAKEQLQERLCFPPDVPPTSCSQQQEPSVLPRSRWRLEGIRQQFPFLHGYSLPGVSLFVRGCGIHLRQGQPEYFSPDPAYRAKEHALLSALREAGTHPERVVVLFLDEISYTRWPWPSWNWCAQAPAPRPVGWRHQSRYQRYRVVGALNAQTGQVSFLHDSRISRDVFCRFLRQLDRDYPQGQTIYLVWDNWPVHHSDQVQQAVEQLPRLKVLPLPTYAPWLNPIEKLWRKFRQEVDYLHPLAGDWKALQSRVKAFFQQFACGSDDLLRYVGLTGQGKLALALRSGP